MTNEVDFAAQRVLVIDDSAAMRKMLQITVQSLGVRSVDLADSVFEVLFRIEKGGRRYDIVLCDYVLGDGRDGQHLLEELKARKLLPYATVFIMVTGERAYEKVVNAVELAPDDYLLKPFSGQVLMDRISDQLRKKVVLRDLYEYIESELLAKAADEADRLLAEESRYRLEILRVKADVLIRMNRLDEAEQIYQGILAERDIPWAQFGLAQIAYRRHQLGQAESILDKLLAHSPRYTAACDLLAEVKHDLEKHQDAQGVLEHGIRMSPRNIRRHRTLGLTAMLNGDMATADASLTAVMEFGQHSALVQATDYANLARCAIALGDPARAKKIMSRGVMRLPNDGRMRVAECFFQGIVGGVEARSSVEAAVGMLGGLRDEGHALDHDLALVGMEACLKVGMLEGAVDLANSLFDAQRERSGEVHARTASVVSRVFAEAGCKEAVDAIFERSRQQMAAMNNEAVGLAKEGRLREAMALFIRAAAGKSAAIVAILNAIHAILVVLDKEGWEDDLARQLNVLFDRAVEKDAANPKLSAHREHYGMVMRKYGIRSPRGHGGGAPGEGWSDSSDVALAVSREMESSV